MHAFQRVFWSWLLLVVSAALAPSPATAAVLHKTTQVGGVEVQYELVLPNGYDAARAYPAVLVFGGGPQTVEGDQRMISMIWRDVAEQRGYIVVMPAAPNGVLYFQGGQRIIPAFLRQIMAEYKIQGGKFRVAGASNGGISAFEVAARYPQYFTSITALPGFLEFVTPEDVAAISKMCIHMFVGEVDELGFRPPMEQLATELRRQHLAVTYQVEPNQGHRIATLEGAAAARLFDQFDQDRHGCVRDR